MPPNQTFGKKLKTYLNSYILTLACGVAIGFGVATLLRDRKDDKGSLEPIVLRRYPAVDQLSAERQERETERTKDLRRESKYVTDVGQLSFLANGNVIVPAALADRIRIRATDIEGNVSADELALLGLGPDSVKKLQDAIDRVKIWELEREAAQREIVWQNENGVTIRIPGGMKDSSRKQQFDDELDAIFGRSRAFVDGSISHIGELAARWGDNEIIVSAKPLSDGNTEYKFFQYDSGRTPALIEGSDLSAGAISIRSFRGKGVPERLRHLFK